MYADRNEHRQPMFLGYGTTNDLDGERNRYIEDHLVLPKDVEIELRKKPEKDELGFHALVKKGE